jgi:Tfp pilus assembly PilM family ATPase
MPLGIDIGSTRMRIAETNRDDQGISVRSVMVIDIERNADDEHALGALIAQTLRERNIRERRCVAAVGEPDAHLHTVVFPPMTVRERERAGTFEAMRHIDYPVEEAFVRSVAIPQAHNTHALGIVRRNRLERVLSILRAAGLRATALDHEAYALQRVFPYADAILDMGYIASRIYVFAPKRAPLGIALETGSHAFTQAIADSLSIHIAAAERRKRTIGLSGAGKSEMSAFASSIGRALLTARNHGMPDAHRLIVTGNGARLPGLAERLERDTGCAVDIASHIGVEQTAYPNDITRASAPDWALCVGLALWSAQEKP